MSDPLAKQLSWQMPDTSEWREVKLLSQTMQDLRAGIPAIKALTYRYNRALPFTRLYFPTLSRVDSHNVDNIKSCMGLCSKTAHEMAIVCRFCKQDLGTRFDLLESLSHLRDRCPKLPVEHKHAFIAALEQADAVALFEARQEAAKPSGASPKKRGHDETVSLTQVSQSSSKPSASVAKAKEPAGSPATPSAKRKKIAASSLTVTPSSLPAKPTLPAPPTWTPISGKEYSQEKAGTSVSSVTKSSNLPTSSTTHPGLPQKPFSPYPPEAKDAFSAISVSTASRSAAKTATPPTSVNSQNGAPAAPDTTPLEAQVREKETLVNNLTIDTRKDASNQIGASSHPTVDRGISPQRFPLVKHVTTIGTQTETHIDDNQRIPVRSPLSSLSSLSRSVSPVHSTKTADTQTTPALSEGLPLVYIADWLIGYLIQKDDVDTLAHALEDFCLKAEVEVYIADEARSLQGKAARFRIAREVIALQRDPYLIKHSRYSPPPRQTQYKVHWDLTRIQLRRPDLPFAVHCDCNSSWVPIEDVHLVLNADLYERLEALFSRVLNLRPEQHDASIQTEPQTREMPASVPVKKDAYVQTEQKADLPPVTAMGKPLPRAARLELSQTVPLSADDTQWLLTQLRKVDIEDVQDLLTHLPAALLDDFVCYITGQKALIARYRLGKLLRRLQTRPEATSEVAESSIEGLPKQLLPYQGLLGEMQLTSYAELKSSVEATREDIENFVDFVSSQPSQSLSTPAARIVFQIAIEAAYKAEGLLEGIDK